MSVPNISIPSIPNLTLKTGVEVQKASVFVGKENALNFIEGTGISLTIADSPSNGRVDLTIATTGVSTVAGVDGNIQYNNGGVFGGAISLNWDDITNALILGKSLSTNPTLLIQNIENAFQLDIRYADAALIAGSYTIFIPIVGGTLVTNATLPLAIDGDTGTITVNSSALTKTDDTNVTLTLGGSPTTALLAATSITVGWTGTLADARLSTTAVTPASYGSTTQVGTFTVSATGRLTAASNVTITPAASSITGGQNLSVGNSIQITAGSGTAALLVAATIDTIQDIRTTAVPTFAGANLGYVYPPSDSTTAFQIRKANASTVVLDVDTTNSRVGVGITPTADFQVQKAANTVILVRGTGAGNRGQVNIAGANGSTAQIVVRDNPAVGDLEFIDNGFSAVNLTIKNAGGIIVNRGHVLIGSSTDNAYTYIVQSVSTTGSPTAFRVDGGAHTTLSNAETIDVNFNLARNVQFTGSATLAMQRAFVIQAPTYLSDTAGKGITTAATFVITGAPVAGTNVTIVSSISLWVQAGFTKLEGTLTVTGVSSFTGDVYSYANLHIDETAGGIYFSTSANKTLYIDNSSHVVGVNHVATGQVFVSGGTTSAPAWSSSPTITGLTLSGLTLGSVIFAGTSGVLSQDNTNLFYDTTNTILYYGLNSTDSTKLARDFYMRGRFRIITAATNASSMEFAASASGSDVIAGKSSAGGAYVDMRFFTNNTQKFTIDTNGNIVPGTAALSTSATDGFIYLQSCAGAPTGTPTTKTGRVACIYDTTNNKFYVYNGAWKSVTLT